MPSISLKAAAHGADLTVDGTTIATLTLRGSDAEVSLAPVDTDHLSVVRQPRPASGGNGIAIDGDYVVARLDGQPDVRLRRITADTDGDTTTPVNVPDIHGQDMALHSVLYAMERTVADPTKALHTLIYGPTGAGKTALCRKAAELAGWSFVMLSIDPDSTKWDLLGEHSIPVDGETAEPRWIPGPFERAVRRSQSRPVLVLIDEPNRALKSSIFASLYSVLDVSRELPLPGGERIPVGTMLVVAAANPADDVRTQYEVRELDPAFADRFGQTVRVDYPAPEVERDVLLEQVVGIDPDTALSLCETARSVRQSDAVSYPFGFRTLMAWATKVRDGFDVYVAADTTFIPKAAPEEREALRSYIQMHFPQEA
jgi:hypothetical protein